jgi:subtilisin family serine protease
MDIITASIGAINGWADNAWAAVASRIAEEGIVITISAGNDGEAGPFLFSSGSAGENVIAVASTEGDTSAQPLFHAHFTNGNKTESARIGYIPSTTAVDRDIRGWPIVPISNDTHSVDDACRPFPEGAFNLTGKIPLVRRAGCSMQAKQENLNALGAEIVILYNDKRPLAQLYTDNSDSIAILIEARSGEAIVEAVTSGLAVTVDFLDYWTDVVSLPRDYAGVPSTFTSWGGLYDLKLKPDIAAPGGQIFSSLPNGHYGIMSGTSMAAPYVAGVVALYIQVHGGRAIHGKGFAKQVVRRVISSGTSRQWGNDGTIVAPPVQVGTGLINALRMINYKTVLDFDKMELNDTANFNAVHEVTVTNTGDEAIKYTLEVQDASGVETYYDYDGGPYSPRIRSYDELSPIEMSVDVLLPEPFTLGPGDSKTVQVTFSKPPQEWNATMLPLYSGKIFINGTNNESLSIPYMGLASDLRKEMDNMFMAGYPTLTTTTDRIDVHQKPNWTNDVWGSEEDWPRLTLQLKWGTAELRWDIYEPGFNESMWEYPPVVGRNGYLGSATNYAGSYSGDFNRSDSPELLESYPLTHINRNGIITAYRHTLFWFGRFANGTQIEPGQYDMRIAVLKPFGDRSFSKDWDVMDTPTISILGKYGPNPWQQGDKSA